MRRIILSGVHSVGKTTLIKAMYNALKSQGFSVRIYSLDNFKVYRHTDIFSSQNDRMFFGAQKLKEAEEESPEIALFDRTLTENILYCRCFNRFSQPDGKKYLSDDELTSIIRYYQSLEQRKLRAESTIIFLNPSIEIMLKNIKERGREKGTILEQEEFVKCLKKMFETHYHQYFDSPLLELNEYNEKTILDKLPELDLIQTNYE